LKLAHFEQLRPICPVCRAGPLALARVVSGSPKELDEGLLECGSCHHLFPVIDGIPLLVRDLRRVVNDQILSVMARTDLSETTLSLLGECCGPGSPYDTTRQHLSMYLDAHWEKGAVLPLLEAGLARLPRSDAPVLDVGCSVGRSTLALGARGLTVGVDLNFAMLRVARRTVREGLLTYPRRESGMVYEERVVAVEVDRAHADRVDFWCADATALPFRDATFGLIASLNLVDIVPSPLLHLQSVRDLLEVGGRAIVATPFDWAAHATPIEQWLGGHSPLGPARGRPEAALRALVGGEQLSGLAIEAERDDLEWPVRLHARAEMRYRVALWVLRKLESQPVERNSSA
jgi:SAM-dependent methyltransferase/uncharacterized protein YbaR (Trm112 family)